MRYFLVFAFLCATVVVSTSRREHPKIRKYKNQDTEGSRRVNAVQRTMDDPSRHSRTGRYFQDIFTEHLEPLKIQFGHVCEDPHEWEQRFERKDLKNNKHQGKVRWGNANEEYGEHYWDLNHGQ